MSVIDFHTIPVAHVRWRDMEQYHKLKALGLIPVLDDGPKVTTAWWGMSQAEYDAGPQLVDTAPCETNPHAFPDLSYRHQSGDPA